MGSGGGSSGLSSGRNKLGNGSADGALSNSPAKEFETYYRRPIKGGGGGYWKTEILEATTDGQGNLTFSHPTPITSEQASRSTTNYTYKVSHGAAGGETFGINWDNVKSAKGQTYSIRSEMRSRGFTWDGERKKWIKK